MLIDFECNVICEDCQDILLVYFVVDDEECNCSICGKTINKCSDSSNIVGAVFRNEL